jgi:hypothetical protein
MMVMAACCRKSKDFLEQAAAVTLVVLRHPEWDDVCLIIRNELNI